MATAPQFRSSSLTLEEQQIAARVALRSVGHTAIPASWLPQLLLAAPAIGPTAGPVYVIR